MLTPDQRAASIAFVQNAADAATSAINAADWHWWEGDAKATQIGAVAIVRNTVVPAMQHLAAAAAAGDELADDKIVSLGHTAEDSLRAIRGYAASAMFDAVVASTVTQTVADTTALAEKAGATALELVPVKVWIVLGVVAAGLAVFYIPRRTAAS